VKLNADRLPRSPEGRPLPVFIETIDRDSVGVRGSFDVRVTTARPNPAPDESLFVKTTFSSPIHCDVTPNKLVVEDAQHGPTSFDLGNVSSVRVNRSKRGGTVLVALIASAAAAELLFFLALRNWGP
jgi:hypothetical protein